MTERESTPFMKTEAEWRSQLTAKEYRVLREADTEPAYEGEYTDTNTPGTYKCRACGAKLFSSDTKFDANCGWPAFYQPTDESSVDYHEDNSVPGMPRTEVRCTNCGSHLGHVFSGEGFSTPTDLRYCINSIALTLEPSN